jgi:hypothetical protein
MRRNAKPNGVNMALDGRQKSKNHGLNAYSFNLKNLLKILVIILIISHCSASACINRTNLKAVVNSWLDCKSKSCFQVSSAAKSPDDPIYQFENQNDQNISLVS